ncbi:MAG: hypothetical protein H6738_13275 [Alphaproteobacteria bacterium]|nr:hypothetical protein [Alphaproteobacteria bacterium]MCB9697748.1 hypothetical protein [Alphaproteobacteria bacterium]
MGPTIGSGSKVPEVTLGFWVLKILATTLGETGGDAVSMTLDLGYLVGSAIFAAIFVVAVLAQVRARSFRPFLYWAVVVATTTLGTTMADFATRSLGIGYAGGTALLVVGLIASLAVWRSVEGAVAVDDIETPRVEAFYWGTILFSQTLGTALGDWVADTPDVGFVGGAVLFGSALAAIALAARFSSISRTVLFWSAFVLTRPLGATLGDLIDKPLESGGYEVDRFVISGALGLAMVVGLLLLPQRAGGHPSRHSS